MSQRAPTARLSTLLETGISRACNKTSAHQIPLSAMGSEHIKKVEIPINSTSGRTENITRESGLSANTTRRQRLARTKRFHLCCMRNGLIANSRFVTIKAQISFVPPLRPESLEQRSKGLGAISTQQRVLTLGRSEKNLRLAPKAFGIVGFAPRQRKSAPTWARF